MPSLDEICPAVRSGEESNMWKHRQTDWRHKTGDQKSEKLTLAFSSDELNRNSNITHICLTFMFIRVYKLYKYAIFHYKCWYWCFIILMIWNIYLIFRCRPWSFTWSYFSKTCLIRYLCNPFHCGIRRCFSFSFDHYIWYLHCVIWHPVYPNTKCLS